MSDPYVSLDVEHPSAPTVEEAVQKYLRITGNMVFGGLYVEVSNMLEEARYARDFLRERGLPDVNPLWNKYDPTEFPVDVRISAEWGSVGDACKEVVADLLAEWLSRHLGVRVAVSVDNGEVPLAVYRSGVVLERFPREVAAFFASRRWVPRET